MWFKKWLRAACMGWVLAGCVGGVAQADITIPVVNGQHLRPHFWDLPNRFEGRLFTPGQMLFVNQSHQYYGANGQRGDYAGGTQRTVYGITALPVAFKLKPGDDWAYIAGLDIQELTVTDDTGTLFSGQGNVLGDFIAWTRPSPDTSMGVNVLLGTPLHMGGDRLSRNQDLHLRGFVSHNVAGHNLEATVGYQHTYDSPASLPRVRDNYHVNLRWGRDWMVETLAARATPYVGYDRMWTDSGYAQLTQASVGVQLAHAKGTSWGVSRLRSLSGRNAPVADMWQAQLWLLY